MRLLIRNYLSPGDILMLTAAVRDLKRAKPEWRIGVSTSCMEIWDCNPNIDRSVSPSNADKVIHANYPLFRECNRLPYHFIHGFRMDLENTLGITIPQGEFKADVHLDAAEKTRKWVDSRVGEGKPYWILNAGGKMDFTCKHWEYAKYQKVVDETRDVINWVQTGSRESRQPDIKGVMRDLRGRTTIRDMMKLMYHASGVLTAVSFPMHLATMDTPDGRKRPCVVVAGGREPVTWEAYPTHQFIHNCGCYPCNRDGGCWRSRVEYLDDGDKDHNSSICSLPVKTPSGQVVPKCMDDISVDDVVRAIRRYIQA